MMEFDFDAVKNSLLNLAKQYNFKHYEVLSYNPFMILNQVVFQDLVKACKLVMEKIINNKLIDDPKEYKIEFRIEPMGKIVFINQIWFIITNEKVIKVLIEFQDDYYVQKYNKAFEPDKKITPSVLHKHLFKLFSELCDFVKDNPYGINYVEYQNYFIQAGSFYSTTVHSFKLSNSQNKEYSVFAKSEFVFDMFISLNDAVSIYQKLFNYLLEGCPKINEGNFYTKIELVKDKDKEDEEIKESYKYEIECNQRIPNADFDFSITFENKTALDLNKAVDELFKQNNIESLKTVSFGYTIYQDIKDYKANYHFSNESINNFALILQLVHYLICKIYDFADMYHIAPYQVSYQIDTIDKLNYVNTILRFVFDRFYPALKAFEKECT